MSKPSYTVALRALSRYELRLVSEVVDKILKVDQTDDSFGDPELAEVLHEYSKKFNVVSEIGRKLELAISNGKSPTENPSEEKIPLPFHATIIPCRQHRPAKALNQWFEEHPEIIPVQGIVCRT